MTQKQRKARLEALPSMVHFGHHAASRGGKNHGKDGKQRKTDYADAMQETRIAVNINNPTAEDIYPARVKVNAAGKRVDMGCLSLTQTDKQARVIEKRYVLQSF